VVRKDSFEVLNIDTPNFLRTLSEFAKTETAKSRGRISMSLMTFDLRVSNSLLSVYWYEMQVASFYTYVCVYVCVNILLEDVMTSVISSLMTVSPWLTVLKIELCAYGINGG
jgi:hypothetical protein